MARFSLLMMSLLLVSACGRPSQSIVTTTAPPNSAAQPSPSPMTNSQSMVTTVVPPNGSLLRIDLDRLVIQPGDLPPMEATLEQQPPSPSLFGNTRPGVATSFARLITKGENVYGSIYVDVYTDTIDTKKAYENDAELEQESAQHGYTVVTPPIGEQAFLRYNDEDDVSRLVFVRCHAHVRINLPASHNDTLVYAKHLDARLTPLVCP